MNQLNQIRSEILTKALNAGIGDLSLFGRGAALAQVKAENLITAWTGDQGKQIVLLAERALREAGFAPAPLNAKRALTDLPWLAAFAVRHPSLNAESLAQFSKNYAQAQSYLKALTGSAKEPRYEDVQPYLPASTYQALAAPQIALQSILTTLTSLYRNPTLSAAPKRQFIDALTFQAIKVADQGNQVFAAVEKTLKKSAAKK